jgi:hypothetical protein
MVRTYGSCDRETCFESTMERNSEKDVFGTIPRKSRDFFVPKWMILYSINMSLEDCEFF